MNAKYESIDGKSRRSSCFSRSFLVLIALILVTIVIIVMYLHSDWTHVPDNAQYEEEEERANSTVLQVETSVES